MRKIILLILISFFIPYVFCASVIKSKTKNITEYPSLNYIEDKSEYIETKDGNCLLKMNYNESGVFIQLLVMDKMTQMRFINEGISIYLDLNGKQKKNHYVSFPTVKREKKKQDNNYADKELEGNRQMSGEPHFDIKSVLFGLSLEPIILNSDKKEIVINSDQAKISLSDEVLIYSCIIPFNLVIKKASKKKDIALGLFYGSVKNSSDKGPDGKSMSGNSPG